MFLKNKQFFSFFFFLWLFAFADNFQDYSFYGGLFFVYLVFIQIVAAEYNGKSFLNSFDIGFFTAIAVFLHSPFWLFAAFLFLYFFLHGKQFLRHFILTFFGMLILGLLVVEVLTLFEFWEIKQLWLAGLPIELPTLSLRHLWLLPIGAFIVIALINYTQHLMQKSIENKRMFFNSLLFFGFAVAYFILYANGGNQAFILFAFPVALLLSNWSIYEEMSSRKELLLWMFLVCIFLFWLNPSLHLPALFDRITF